VGALRGGPNGVFDCIVEPDSTMPAAKKSDPVVLCLAVVRVAD